MEPIYFHPEYYSKGPRLPLDTLKKAVTAYQIDVKNHWVTQGLPRKRCRIWQAPRRDTGKQSGAH